MYKLTWLAQFLFMSAMAATGSRRAVGAVASSALAGAARVGVGDDALVHPRRAACRLGARLAARRPACGYT